MSEPLEGVGTPTPSNVTPSSLTDGPDHRAAPAVPTQVLYPWKAALRTALQVGPPALVALLLVLPPIINDFLETFRAQLPAEAYAWLAGIAVTITLASAFASRAMATLRAVEFFRKHLPAAAPDTK